MNKHASLAALAAVFAPLAFGDVYQFFRDYATFEAANAFLAAASRADSHSGESDAVALDGVNRTVAESRPTHLYTDKEGPAMLILK